MVLAGVLGLFVPYPVIAATSSQVASRISPRLVDLIAALATGAVGSVALARSDISDTLPGWPSPSPSSRRWPSSD